MKDKSSQIVIDTNILASAMRSKTGASFQLLDLIGKGFFEINLSVALLCEYEDVIKRPGHTKRFTPIEIEDFLDYIIGNSNHHDIYFLWRPALPDPKDDFLLELAIASGSKYIVTYNLKDFAGCESFGIEAIRPMDFLNLVENYNE